MKVALCFIINYDHVLHKEQIWIDWIDKNKDIINVYFFYKDFNKIKSKWIKQYALPKEYIKATSYFHVIPAYLNLLNYAITQDKNNRWFCMLTESCCPIISPYKFRKLFEENKCKSILNWKQAWWNPLFHKRSNLNKISQKLWLVNDPWFILSKTHVELIFNFAKQNIQFVKLICDGGLANESLFVIILKILGKLNEVICEPTHLTDWNRMTSKTSPYLFKQETKIDNIFITNELFKHKYLMFIRKISPDYPDETLKKYIYNTNCG